MRRRDLLLSTASLLAGGSLPRAAGLAQAQPTAAATDQAVKVALRAAPLAAGGDALSYNGTPAGPVLRIGRGETLEVTLANDLDQPTGLQWQGLRGVPGAAGPQGAGAAVQPGQRFTTRITPPDSGTFLFRAAPLPGLADQAAAGLRGVLVVDEAPPLATDRDQVLVLSDGPAGAVMVNGAPAPLAAGVVSGGRARLRLVNASTVRLMVLRLEGAVPAVVAVDGQPCPPFAPVRNSVPIGPGARFDVLLDMPRQPDRDVTLRLAASVPVPEGAVDTTLALATFTTAGPAAAQRPPALLPANGALPAEIHLENASRANLLIEAAASPAPGAARYRLNGKAAIELPKRPLLSVRAGGPVTLELDNRLPVPVPLRIGGQAVRLLHAKDDGWEPYWRDGVILAPATVTHVAFVPDVPGRWIIDSAAFAQGTSGLRTWLEVTPA